MADVYVGSKAFCKVILHAAKYPHCAVNGLLLAERKKSGEIRSLQIADSIPLFHICRHLSPMLEVALAQIDHYCKSAGLFIAGYYQANESLRDSGPDFVALRVADKIAENHGDACLVMVDNRQVCLDMDRSPLNFYRHVEGKWVKKDEGSIHFDDETGTLSAASVLLQKKAYRILTDFDNHLDNIAQEWLNTNLNEVIEEEL